MSIVVITPPADTPVSLAETKAHLRVEDDGEDVTVSSLIQVATQSLDGPDGWLGRALMPQTLEVAFDCFAKRIPSICGGSPYFRWAPVLPCRPIISITSISYTDQSGSPQTVPAETYSLVDGAVHLAYGASWPVARHLPGSVKIRYQAGYADAATVPAPIKHAILLMIGNLWANREAVVDRSTAMELPQGSEALLAPFRVWA